MLGNYIKIALRALAKNRLYAAINILGLALGMSIYLFGGIVANYEQNHDVMFKNHERIYTIGSVLSPNANIGVKALTNTYTAVGPLVKAEIEEIELMARTVRRSYLISIDDTHFHESVRFTDPALLEMFEFDYIAGDKSALNDPQGVVLTRAQAMKYFNSVDVLNKTLQLDHRFDLTVKAVIEELPQNSHFNSFVLSSDKFNFITTLKMLNKIDDWDLNGNWYNISGENNIYIMSDGKISEAELEHKVNAVFDRHVEPETQEKFMASLELRVLKETHAGFWDMVGMPVIESIQILGLLVLVIAIVNYTNLATAQSMGRTKEVGLRKTLGASRGQLMAQFMVESLTIASIAMVISVVILELIIPQFNVMMSKVMTLDYLAMLPWLLATTATVGILAGLYPSYLITQTATIDALKGSNTKGRKGQVFRAWMIGVQFVIAIFMLAMVLIVYFQNLKVEQSSNIFPKDEVLTLSKLRSEAIRTREDILRTELLKVPNVEHVTFASQVPFEQSNNTSQVSRVKGDENSKIQANNLYLDHDYLKTFDIPLVAGRDFSREISSDNRSNNEAREANVIINELLTQKLGFDNPQEAVGHTFWGMPGELEPFQYNVVGVVKDQNILGLHHQIKPWVFMINNDPHFFGAIRIAKGASAKVITDIEETWAKVIPDYPIEHKFLSGKFGEVYRIYEVMNDVLAGFALLALTLALIGLFGLAAFMARSRTKEIGVRKVLGASITQIVTLLLWQFSKPVMWAILVALPLAYFASAQYLQFFAYRIEWQIPIILLSGVGAVALAWLVISLHAIKVAKGNTINALRYE